MKSVGIMLVTAAQVAVAYCASPSKAVPVAEGFPNWEGLVPKNYICGRQICDSDLRHRVVIVFEIEPSDNMINLMVTMGHVSAVSPLVRLSESGNWETRELPRNIAIIVSVRNGGKDVVELIKKGVKNPRDKDGKPILEAMQESHFVNMASMGVSFYTDVAYPESPDTSGKRPYVYVLGHQGKDPLYQGELKDSIVNDVQEIVRKAEKALPPEWKPFYGYVTEPQYNKSLAKTLEKGKGAKTCPLDAVSKALLKDIASQDPERALEAQMLYDAIEQTRSDLLLRIYLEYAACPHRAYYDVQQLLKYWPKEKKRLENIVASIKEKPGAEKLAQIYCKLMVWADPNFMCKNAGEVKKIVSELNKFKKDINKFKDSTVIVVQNGALLMDMQIDELISVMPSKIRQ